MLNTIQHIIQIKEQATLATCCCNAPHMILANYLAGQENALFSILLNMNSRTMRNLRQEPRATLLIRAPHQNASTRQKGQLASYLSIGLIYQAIKTRDELLRLKKEFAAKFPQLSAQIDRGDSTIALFQTTSFLLHTEHGQQHVVTLEKNKSKSSKKVLDARASKA